VEDDLKEDKRIHTKKKCVKERPAPESISLNVPEREDQTT
jgi:hypothetical protein